MSDFLVPTVPNILVVDYYPVSCMILLYLGLSLSCLVKLVYKYFHVLCDTSNTSHSYHHVVNKPIFSIFSYPVSIITLSGMISSTSFSIFLICLIYVADGTNIQRTLVVFILYSFLQNFLQGLFL